ncbi:MAG: ABC transporter ATP-binding protein, partial [Chromatiaceae bacterium]
MGLSSPPRSLGDHLIPKRVDALTASLQCDAITKQFQSQVVLSDISLDLPAGQCLVLLGPSGCGKTTLLNIMTGMHQADGGQLRCDGEILDDRSQGIHQSMQRRGFAMVFQDFSLWPHMTVAGNVEFGLKIQGVSTRERRARVMQALEQVQMAAFADRRPGTLSGGQAQRVAIARALVVRPRVLLMDEPLSALDARLREELKSEISTLLRETGTTAVYVTHDQSEAFTLADRVALMHQGRIEQLDSPEVLYARPRTRFAANFIGASNVIPYRREGNRITLRDRHSIVLSPQTMP